VGINKQGETELDYTEEVQQLFADLGEELTEEELPRVVAAFKAGTEGGADFAESARKFGVFQELFRVN
jgi:hypothetical protein